MSHESPGSTLRIGLASVRNHPDVESRLDAVDAFLHEAGERGVAIVCFPEAYIPGLRGMDFEVAPPDQTRQERALERVANSARSAGVGVVLGMEWEESGRILNVAFVIGRNGEVNGFQSKNQIPPQEEPFYVAGETRRMFEVDGVPFGITICHEGWRYPESVRWAARQGAKVVFHPHLTGSDSAGPSLEGWGAADAPYYEKAMMMRSIENTVYFASVNCAMRYQESATSLIDPEGECVAYVPYGEEQLLVCDLDLQSASGFLAARYEPAFYPKD